MENNILLLHQRTVIPGTHAIYAVNPEWPAPVGYIYYRQVLGEHFEYLDCYVFPTQRRHGVLTSMFLRLSRWYPKATFITQCGNHYSTPWLIKMGFQKRDDGWWLAPRVAPTPPKQKPKHSTRRKGGRPQGHK